MATLVVNKLINMFAPTVIPGGFEVGFGGAVSQSYRMQRAPAVDGPWTTIGTGVIGITGLEIFTDSNPLPNRAFYRMITP